MVSLDKYIVGIRGKIHYNKKCTISGYILGDIKRILCRKKYVICE